MKQCHFVFDIDDTLAVHVDKKEWKRDIKDITEMFGEDFAFKHIIWAADYPHCVFPGMPELWRWLDSMGHRFSTCSSGMAIRNDVFVDSFLELAFGDKRKAKELRDNMRVLSRCHLVEASGDDLLKKWFIPNRLFGNYKKVLRDVFCTIDELPYTFLIDDDRSYVARGELQNFLAVRTGCGLHIGHKSPDDGSNHYVFKAFMLAGLLQTIFDLVEETGKTPAEIAKKVQFDDCKSKDSEHYEFEEIDKFGKKDTHGWDDKGYDAPWYETQTNADLFLKGEKILQRLNPQLRLPDGFRAKTGKTGEE